MSTLISVVSPVYKAELIVDELVRRIKASLSEITEDYEIILVDDCGPDNSWAKIHENAQKDNRVVGIKLSRNFGQHHAITAGIDCAKGKWVVVMDCDLQDRPEEILRLYEKANEGFDIIFARRVIRKDTFFKRLSSKIFYNVFSYLSNVKQDNTIANFGMYSNKVIHTMRRLREPMRAFSPMVNWVGFKKTSIDVQHSDRFEGKTSYSFGKLINLALDIAVSYSDKPLKLTIKLGLIISMLSVVFTLYTLVMYKLGYIKISGYTSIIISIWFLSGLIIFTLGILGLYLSKIFEGVKSRPIYIIDEQINGI